MFLSAHGCFACSERTALTNCTQLIFPAAFAGAIAVWGEEDRLHLSETPDRVILFIHVSLSSDLM